MKKLDNAHHSEAAKALKNKIDEIEVRSNRGSFCFPEQIAFQHLASLPQKEAELSKLNAENEERCRMLEEHAEGVNRYCS